MFQRNPIFLYNRDYPPIWTKSDQNVTKDDRIIFARIVLPRWQTCFCPRQNISLQIYIFKNTIYKRRPRYLDTHVRCLNFECTRKTDDNIMTEIILFLWIPKRTSTVVSKILAHFLRTKCLKVSVIKMQ